MCPYMVACVKKGCRVIYDSNTSLRADYYIQIYPNMHLEKNPPQRVGLYVYIIAQTQHLYTHLW